MLLEVLAPLRGMAGSLREHHTLLLSAVPTAQDTSSKQNERFAAVCSLAESGSALGIPMPR